MNDIERRLVDGLTEFNAKLKRGDLIEAKRLSTCPTCEGRHPEWCSGCGGTGFVSNPSYLNDWPPTGAGSAGGGQ